MNALRYAVLTVLAVALLSIKGHAQQYEPTNISITNSGNQRETSISADPNNQDHLMATWNEFNSSPYQPGYGFSTDGGHTWSTGILGVTGYDPSCAIGTSGREYYTYVDASVGGAVEISSSTDNGSNWSTTNQVSSSSSSQDKPYMAIDNTGGTYNGRIYVAWTDLLSGNSIDFAFSSDGGAHWTQQSIQSLSVTPDATMMLKPSSSMPSPSPFQTPLIQSAEPAVGPNGNVYVVYQYLSNISSLGAPGGIRFVKSTDGGSHFSSPVSIASFPAIWSYGVGWLRVSSYPTIAVDPSSGNIYVAWTEDDNGEFDIYSICSTDDGTTWSSPTLAAQAGTGLHFFPWLTVNSSGVVSLSYYEGNSSSVNVYMAESYNDGQSFTGNDVRITPASENPSSGSWTCDYMGCVSLETGRTLPLWTDFSTGTTAHVYSTPNYFSGGTVSQTLTLPSGQDVVFSPGSTTRLASGALIVADAVIDASGSSSEPVVFKQSVPGSHWDLIQLTTSDNQFTDCVFDGGTVDVDITSGSGDTFTGCTFENGSLEGLYIGAANANCSIYDCTFQDNQTGLDLWNGSTASVSQSTINNNTGVGLFMTSGGTTISSFTNNKIESNGSYGIDVEDGTLYMGNGTAHYSLGTDPNSTTPTPGAGKNRIDGNCTSSGSAQIYVDESGRLYVGELFDTNPDYYLLDGFNRVTSSTTLYIYNLALTYVNESEEQWTIPAAKTYWGGSVNSGDFYGTVDYSYQLTSDPSGGAGAGSPLQDITAPTVNKTPATLMTAAMAARISEDVHTSGMGQFFVDLKNKMMQVMNNIKNPQSDMTRPRMIGYLSSLCSFDRNNVTGERRTVQQLISNYYGQLASGNFSDETDRLCSEAALVTEVQNEVDSGKLDSAEALMNDYGKYVQNNDNKRTLLFAQMDIDQRHGHDGKALGVLKQIKSFQPDSKQSRRYEAPDYAVIASGLSHGVNNPSQAKEVASVQTQKVPTKFALLQNYPNPFNPTTTIDYDLAAPANVRLIVYDVTGQEVAVLENGYESAGAYHAVFNGSRFASGVYFVRLITQGQNGRQYIKTMKMMMLK